MKTIKFKTSVYFTKIPDNATKIKISYTSSDLKREFAEISYTDGIITCYFNKDDELKTKKFRELGGKTTNWLKKHMLNQVSFEESTLDLLAEHNLLTAFTEGMLLGNYEFDQHKSDLKSDWLLEMYYPENYSESKEIIRIQKYCHAVEIARDLGNEPANVINPVTLAEKCVVLANDYGLDVEILDEKQLIEMGSGGIISVGKGSESQPRMIIMEHKGVNPEEAPIVLVGKAITFDTGGYSLKPVDGIQGMKFDKLGGMAIIGIMVAAALLDLPQRIIGIVPAAENMISDHAYRPDDVIKTLSGKTVEIISTDAEGRLILADGLTYGETQYSPKYIIDFATLTGGIVVALGNVRAGLFSSDETLANKLETAGESSGEKLWRMPLDEEYFEFIKGDYGDLKNSGGRKGHPIFGGIFLKQFIQNTPWAHIDIAGVATNDKAGPFGSKGANGFGVRLILDFLENL